MLAVLHFQVSDEDAFAARAACALEVLSQRPGFLGGEVSRAVEETGRWLLTTRWEGAGTFRRALSYREVKMHAVPLLQECLDGPTVWEDLITATDRGLDRRDSELRVTDGRGAADGTRLSGR